MTTLFLFSHFSLPPLTHWLSFTPFMHMNKTNSAKGSLFPSFLTLSLADKPEEESILLTLLIQNLHIVRHLSSSLVYLHTWIESMGRDFLLLSTLILLLSGFVSSAPSANSPASKSLPSFPFRFQLSISQSLFLFAEIINGFIANHGSSLMKWIWSLKTTTKTSSFFPFRS